MAMGFLTALVAGLLFGTGLVVSGMTVPANVLAFLDVAGDWDPGLAAVMATAIAVTAPALWLLKKRGGAVWVAAATALLAPLFCAFDATTGTSDAVSAALALLWALAPVAVGVIVWRLGRKRD